MAKMKLVPGKSFYFAGIMFMIIGMIVGFQYTRIERSPRVATTQESVAVLDQQKGKHWVRITGLELDCSKPIQDLDNGKVVRTFYLAADHATQRTFIVETNGCSADPAQPYEGMLESYAGDYILKTIAGRGVSLAADSSPHLSVGETPSGELHAALLFLVLGSAGLVATWWTRKRAFGPEKPYTDN